MPEQKARYNNCAETLLDLILQLEEAYRKHGNAPLAVTPDGFNDYPIELVTHPQGFRLKAKVESP